MQKRKHFVLPEPYQTLMEERAKAENRSESNWVAVHIMNAIDSGTPAVRVRKADGP